MFDENKHPRDDQGKFTEKYKQNATAKEILSSSKKDKISSPYPFVKKDNGEEFKQALLDAKDHYRLDAKWRVSSDYTPQDYESDGFELYRSGDSVYALEREGNGKDIVSVCAVKESGASGSQLLQDAVKNGGDRLDAFSGIYDFYVKNGFHPVSWISFDEQFAPDEWKKAKEEGIKVQKEPIIFYMYVGKPYEKSLNDFLISTKESKSYDEGKERRDQEIEKVR
nr:MAG TPA: hypothetical protein [Caudoviricetes sp.]